MFGVATPNGPRRVLDALELGWFGRLQVMVPPRFRPTTHR